MSFKDVQRFHQKFGLKGPNVPKVLNLEEHTFRDKFHREEIDEYCDARTRAVAEHNYSTTVYPDGGMNDEFYAALATQFDSLLDLTYVALGTADYHGFPWERGWYQVQSANMAKVRATRVEDSKRGTTLDVVKPEGWVTPYLDYLMTSPNGTYVMLEGMDNTGKSTLAKLIQERLDLSHYHGPVPPKGQTPQDRHTWYRQRLRGALVDQHETRKDGIVFDRFHLSDYVYRGRLDGSNARMTPEGMADMDEFCRSHDVRLILLTDTPRRVYQRLVKEDNPVTNMLTLDNIEQMCLLFHDTIDLSTAPHRHVTDLESLGSIGPSGFIPGDGFDDLIEWIKDPTDGCLGEEPADKWR